MQKCNLKIIPPNIFKPLNALQYLQLDRNELREIRGEDFANLSELKHLRLDGNKFESLPTKALANLTNLEILNFGSNQVQSILTDSFPNLPQLVLLLLKRNRIRKIEDDSFSSLNSLKILELDDNELTEIPLAVTKLNSLQELSVSGNRITYIPGGILQKTGSLSLLELKGNPIKEVDPLAFSFLPKLRKLILSEARELREFPNLNGTSALEILRLDRASLFSVPSNICKMCPRLKSLDLKSNKLGRVPDLTACSELRLLDLSGNYITSLDGSLFSSVPLLHDLMLSSNYITTLSKDAFLGLTHLQVLDLENNQINHIHPETFLAISQLEDLNLGNNEFSHLPIAGLQKLLHLKTFNNPYLKEFPEPDNFPRIQTLALSYAYHCCSFMSIVRPQRATPPPLQESVIFPKDQQFDMSLWNSSLIDMWPQLQNLSDKFGTQMTDLWDSFGSDFAYPGNLPAYVEEYFEEQQATRDEKFIDFTDFAFGDIKCLPLTGPFLPCQDLFDWWTLRCGVWVVFLLSMLGNGTVVFVLVFSRTKFDVPRFLVCNLAAADFFMGLYLGFLAIVDAATLGEFKMYALKWQLSGWCQFSGVLAVLSSELSVYTLAVITLERNYAITHAMHLNKRLSLKHAAYIMLVGWSFSLLMALLPLFGISDYRKYATCLPLEITNNTWSLTYVVFLMFANGVAFVILMGCYLKMYCAIRGSQAWNSNDSRIAKRMALLVFTDFLCWSPIAFISLTAICGFQLVNLEQAKVLTVFVLPFNSCCNPFLYAILTKQFKKDCVLICKAIEESRVTRGIGRCRHSSNFSNRQTPANTNSLVDRSSRENYAHLQPCSCNTKLLGDKTPPQTESRYNRWLCRIRKCFACENATNTTKARHHPPRSDQYAYQIAEIQQKQNKRASSVSSCENFSSSRSDSWKMHHHCGIPMRLLDPKRRAYSWVVTRKTSADSNLSSSRNDSSGSGNTASTNLSRGSKSSSSSDNRHKPRLMRQAAIIDEEMLESSRLTVRFLSTIPSTAENSVVQEEEEKPSNTLYAILRANTPDQSPSTSKQK